MPSPTRARHLGAFESSGALAAVNDTDGAYADYDTATGTARFGAKGAGAVNRGVAIRTLLAGVAISALAFTPAGAATFAGSIATQAVTATGLVQATVAGESLRLCYDASHYVSFSVSSVGGLTITPQAGQSVSVTGFAASGKTTLSAQTRVGDLFRVESIVAPDASGLAGAGVEIRYDPANFGLIKSWDYTGGGSQKNLTISAAAILLDNHFAVQAGGALITGSNVATGESLRVVQTTTTAGTFVQRWTDNTHYTMELGYVSGVNVALWGATGNSFTIGASSTEMMRFETGGNVIPVLNNTWSFGDSTHKWTAIWATNGTIQTSTRKAKDIAASQPTGLEVLEAIRAVEIAAYSYKDDPGYVLPGETWPEGDQRTAADRKAGIRGRGHRTDPRRRAKHRHFGVMHESLPRWMQTTDDGVNPMSVATLALAGVREVDSEVDRLKARVAGLEAKLGIAA